jgi:H+/Cl- antiporter ClcA
MWPAIATVCIAMITLMGFIAQRNLNFYRKVENVLFVAALITEAAVIAFIVGHNVGIDKVKEATETTVEESVFSNLEYDVSFAMLIILLPFLVAIVTGVIGYVTRQIQRLDDNN